LGGAEGNTDSEPPSAVEVDTAADTYSEPPSTDVNGWDAITLKDYSREKILTNEAEIPIFIFSREKATPTYTKYKLQVYSADEKNISAAAIDAYQKIIGKFIIPGMNVSTNNFSQSVIIEEKHINGLKLFFGERFSRMEIYFTFKDERLVKVSLFKKGIQFYFMDTSDPITLTISIPEEEGIDFTEFINVFKEAGISISDRKTFKEGFASVLTSAREQAFKFFKRKPTTPTTPTEEEVKQ
jgi:hypothetical protein